MDTQILLSLQIFLTHVALTSSYVCTHLQRLPSAFFVPSVVAQSPIAFCFGHEERLDLS